MPQESHKEIIIREAARLFSEKGYERTSMRAIAEAAGVSKPAIYYYFSNKDELFESMLELAASHITDTMVAIRDSTLTPTEKLNFIAMHRFELYNQHPEISKFLMDISGGNIKRKMLANFLDRHKDVRTIVSDIIEEGQTAGSYAEEWDARLVSYMFLGGLNMYLMNYNKTGEGELSTAKAKELVATLIDGIGLSH